MPIDPSEPLSVLEKHTFGHNAVRHPITGIPLEAGSGAHLPKDQAYRVHLPVIAQDEGAAVAAAIREQLDVYYATHSPAEPVIPRVAEAQRSPATSTAGRRLTGDGRP